MCPNHPIILVTCFSLVGHFTPTLQVAAHLAKRGYDVYFVTSPALHETIAKTEPLITCISAVGIAGMLPDETEHPYLLGKTKGWDSLVEVFNVWSMTAPAWLESVQLAMTQIRREHPDRELLIVAETANPGPPLLKLGAPLPEGFSKVPKLMGINVVPPIFTSIDQGPPLFGLPYDPSHSEAVRQRNIMIADLFAIAFKPAIDRLRETIRSCGVTGDVDSIIFGDHASKITHLPLEAMCAPDVVLQMCIPSIEYPISDRPKSFRFGGTLPLKPLPSDFQYPDWFDKISTNSSKGPGATNPERKKIVVVTQGTLAVDWSALLIPTIRSLASHDDVLIVAILGVKGAVLVDVEIPGNTTVVDYFPYDAILGHADVVVTNGSYGIFSHCIAHGVPMVLGGDSHDKPDMGYRGEWVGIAVNLRTGMPSPESISAGVDKILGDEKYRETALKLSDEAREFDALATVERELRALF